MIEKVKLNPGESLKLKSSQTKGTMHETDENTYSIINADGDIVGSVTHTDHTSQRGSRIQSVLQQDMSGAIIVDESW